MSEAQARFWSDAFSRTHLGEALWALAFAILAAGTALLLARALRLDRAVLSGSIDPFRVAAAAGGVLVMFIGAHELFAEGKPNLLALNAFVLGLSALGFLGLERSWSQPPAEAAAPALPVKQAAPARSENRRAA